MWNRTPVIGKQMGPKGISLLKGPRENREEGTTGWSKRSKLTGSETRQLGKRGKGGAGVGFSRFPAKRQRGVLCARCKYPKAIRG